MAQTRNVAPTRGRHPAQVVAGSFATLVAIGTLLLLTPWAKSGSGSASFTEALFTATSATCVTGLAVVDTGSFWSPFGEGVIIALVQVGGFGIMTLASLLGLLIARRLGLRTRLQTAAETKVVGLNDVRSVVFGVLKVTIVFELVVWAILTTRFIWKYDDTVPHAIWDGYFHAVSAFNNAGLSLNSDSLMGYVDDPWVCLPIAIAVIAGGLGFPVWLELMRRYRTPREWNLHTRMTLGTTIALLVIGFVFVTASEWRNPATLGALDTSSKFLAGFVHAVMPRSGGLNSVDTGMMNDGTLFGTIVLMLIGGGSAGTAGGIKVTTFILLFWVIVAELRGVHDVEANGRRIDPRAIRQALTVALVAIGAVVVSTIVFLETSSFTLMEALFETTSGFAVVGLSTGITPELSDFHRVWMCALMFAGRLGPITLVAALALRSKDQLYRLPEGRPIIG